VSSRSAPSSTVPRLTAAATPTINADFTMFVKLLTAQMQNQDPLNPMDTSQYTQQLVQYSQVEQSMAQTSTLKSMLAAMSNSDLTQASNLIGKQVSIDSGTATLKDTPIAWNWSAARDVATLNATITDANGRTIDQRALTPTANGDFKWDGTLSGGGKAPPGSYTINFTGTDANGADVAVSATTNGVVDQVSMESGKVMIGINGQNWPASSLKKVALSS